MIEWLRRQDPTRVFVETPTESRTFAEVITAIEDRPIAGVEVLHPRLDLPSVVDLLAVMSSGSAVLAPPGMDAPDIDPAGAATVVFTSGSTGSPRGARLTIENWEAAARASTEHLGHGAEDTWLLAMPLSHVAGLSILIRSAHAGGKVRMLPDFEPASFARALGEGVTIASVVPTMLQRVLDVAPVRFDGLRAVLVGGGPIPPGLLARAAAAGLPVLPTYGMTETCGQVATLRPGSPLEAKAHPLPGVELRIEPDGRIAVRGAMVSPGYAGEADRPGDWLVSGDLGSLDPDGALRVHGRADAIIVSGGENVSPEMVEAAVARVPGVEDVVVVGVPSEEWGMEVACVYVGEADPFRIESELKTSLPGFMVPKRWERVAAIPRIGLGKPDRARARDLLSSPGGR